jgi:very-short-patch-repair endonuclease
VRAPGFIPPPRGEGPERSEGGGGREISPEAPRAPPDPSLRSGPPSPQGGGMKGATVNRARELRKSMTRYEVKLWLRLRDLKPQGFRFRRQIPLERWIVDFVCFQNRMIVEVDGMQHGFDAQRAADAARDAFFEREGFRVFRFTNTEIWDNIEGVVETIFNNSSDGLPLPAALPPPSPQGGGMKGTP